jgi:CsoR family transcriptional regulator, copper-sensing transcriptional repressor
MVRMPGYTMDKDQYHARLRRIEGQVRGLQRMVDEDTYCIDVLTQIASVTKALQGVGMGLLDEHIRHCVREAAAVEGADGDAAFDDKVQEVTAAVSRMLRT